MGRLVLSSTSQLVTVCTQDLPSLGLLARPVFVEVPCVLGVMWASGYSSKQEDRGLPLGATLPGGER